MRLVSVTRTAKLIIMILWTQGIAEAAELTVLSTTGMKGVIQELFPKFERATGDKLVTAFDVTTILKRRIETGETFDVAILPSAAIGDLIKQGKISADTRADIGRSGVGVCARAGAPKPDIMSAEAFKRAMLSATSISYAAEGTFGKYFLGLLDRLGIAVEMKVKLKPQHGGTIPDAVARGDAELCIAPMSQLTPIVSGAELVGPLPEELQMYVVFTGGVGAMTKEAYAAKALIEFLAAPSSDSVIRAKGMERVTPVKDEAVTR